MFDQSLEGLVTEIEPVPAGIAALQLRNDAQGMGIVIETAVRGHAFVQHFLAGVAETGMTEVVRQGGRLGEILVERKAPRQRPGNLRHFDGMGEAGAEMVAFQRNEYLRLVCQATEGGGMDQPVAVALEVAARWRRRLCK